jgi:hypothetical protein
MSFFYVPVSFFYLYIDIAILEIININISFSFIRSFFLPSFLPCYFIFK